MSSDPPPPTKIFVGKLSDRATSDNLRPLFEEYGEVRECDVLSGYGFVHMATGEEADRAISNLDGCEFMGSNICVEKSTGRKKSGGRGGGRGGGGGPMRGRGGGRGGFRGRGGGGGGDRNTPYDRNGYDRRPQANYNRNGYDGGGYDRRPPPGGRDYPPRDDGYRPPPPRPDPYAESYLPPRDPYPPARDPYPPAPARDPYPPAPARDPYPPAPRVPYASSADPYAAPPRPDPYSYSAPSGAGMYDRRSPQAAAAKAYADPYAQRTTGYDDRGYSGYSRGGGGRSAPY